MKKIFLLGSERSGSNLLRTLLGNHSQISAPIAPHLCDSFINNYHPYYPFAGEKLVSLYKDIETYLNHPFNDWKIEFDIDGMIKKFKPKNFMDILNSVFSYKATKENKSAYFSKDNHNHKYAIGIKLQFPDAYFIYLYRDPRDQVASWMRTPIHLHTPYQAAKKWVDEQKACLNIAKFYGVNIIPVKYEDLVDKTTEVMKGLLQALDLPVEEKCFTTNQSNKEAKAHPLWKNINKPVMKNNYNKYTDVLSNADIAMIETMSGNALLQELGYSRSADRIWTPGNPYWFRLKDVFKTEISRRRNKQFMEKEMKLLQEKKALLKSLRNKKP